MVCSFWRLWGARAAVIFLDAPRACFQLFCHRYQAHAEAVFLNALDQAVRGASELDNLLVDAETAVGAVRSICMQTKEGTYLGGIVVAVTSEGTDMVDYGIATLTVQGLFTHAL